MSMKLVTEGGEITIPEMKDIPNPSGGHPVVSVSKFSDLRSRKPGRDGERVWLDGHTVFGKGGGWFVGHSGTNARDDGGFVAVGDGFYWVRDGVAIEDLTVDEFGAINDGVTDAGPAAELMYRFLRSESASRRAGFNAPGIGIKFGPGAYFVSPRNWATDGAALKPNHPEYGLYPSHHSAAGAIQILGAPTAFGRNILTKIISDKSDKPVFTINHRYMTVEGIVWDGRQTTKPDARQMLTGATVGVFNDTASNKQPFICNECIGGTFTYISAFKAINTGSYSFYLKDTLDSKWDQIYSSKTAGPVFQVGWSNRAEGSWNHSTAIELTNSNFQQAFAPAVWAPRCGQSLMRNVWFEHSFVPFDINNGQWVMEMVCLESSTHHAHMPWTRAQVDCLSTPTSTNIDRVSVPGDTTWYSYTTNPDGSPVKRWLSAYEDGFVQRENHGIEIDGTLMTKIQSGPLRGSNMTDAPLYVRVGSFTFPTMGTEWELEVTCRNGLGGHGTANRPLTACASPGKTIIRMARQAAASQQVITFYHDGESAVEDVLYQPTSGGSDWMPGLWMKLKPKCGEFVLTAKTTGPTRFDAGVCSRFTVDGASTASPNVTLKSAYAKFSHHNGKAGVGAQGELLALSTRSGAPSTASSPAGYLKVLDGTGSEIFLPYFK